MTTQQNILKKQYALDQVEKLSIDTAMKRNWTVPHRKINVQVCCNNVTLVGTVHTKHEHDEAGKIAMQAPGVASVKNELLIVTGKLC